jgi:hypothetical protein
VLLEGIGELHGTSRYERREELTRKRFRHGTDAKDGLLAGTDPRSLPCLAEPRNGALRTADRSDHQARHLVLKEQHCARELYGLLQQPILRSCAL